MNTFVPIINSTMFLIDIGGAIKDFFSDLIENYVFAIFYYIEIALLYCMKLLEYMMMIFTGESPVVYNGKPNSLINVFFNHDSVKGVYMGIGMVGIVFAFAFAIVSVIRKMFDARGKYQGMTMGVIIGNLIKSILLIFGMNAILIASIWTTNVLLQAVSDSFILSKDLTKGSTTITFTEEQYGAMGRILNTIGNYSLNPSYRSRYNLNACYNDIRTDLKYLGDQGVFNYHYEDYDENDNEVVTWQSIMEELGTAYDYNQETTLDSYDDGITNAILDAMEIIKANPNIKVLKSAERKTEEYKGRVTLDRILFLSGTMGTIGTAAARNDVYNKNPDFFDNIRAPFYYGSKDMYSKSDVREVFSFSPLKMNYIVVYVSGYYIAMEMMLVILTCGVRIFNLLALYLIAPLAIASMPMDDGGKFKQWTTAFVVQLLGVVGMVVAIRLFLLLIPIIWNPSLAVDTTMDWESTKSTADIVAKLLNLLLTVILKVVLTYTAVQAISKVNGIFTGILADNAGMQAISAGDMRQAFGESAIGKAMNRNTPFASAESNQKKAEKEAERKAAKASKGGGGAAGAGSGGSGGSGGKGGGAKNAKKAEKAAAKHNKNMKMLDNAIKHGQETGRRMDGKKLSAKDLAVMKGTLGHMKKGMNMKNAKAAALNDYKQQKNKQDAAAAFHKKELKAGPPNKAKAQKKAAKMQDHDYKAMKRDLAFMAENGFHANGDDIKPGERGQMEETLKAYEDMHSGDGGGDSTPGNQSEQVSGSSGNAGDNSGSSDSTPGNQSEQVSGSSGNAGDNSGSSDSTPGNQSEQVSGSSGNAGNNSGSSDSTPGNQSEQVSGSSGNAGDNSGSSDSAPEKQVEQVSGSDSGSAPSSGGTSESSDSNKASGPTNKPFTPMQPPNFETPPEVKAQLEADREKILHPGTENKPNTSDKK